MIAPPENMRAVAHIPGVFAYDPENPWDRYSATAGDYFFLSPNETLTNEEGTELILGREVGTIEEVSA